MENLSITEESPSTPYPTHSAIVETSCSGKGELDFEAKARKARKERTEAAAWAANFDSHQPGGKALSCNDAQFKKLIADFRKEQATKEKTENETRMFEVALQKEEENKKKGSIRDMRINRFKGLLSELLCF